MTNILWITEKARQFQKNIYFCFIDYAKAFDCVDHNKVWKILQDMRIPDHLTCLLRNLNAGQEATVRTRPVTTDWFQIGKGVLQGCILSLCLKSENGVALSCLTLCNPMACSLPYSSIHGIFQARVLEWGANSISRGYSQPRDHTLVSHTVGRLFTIWAVTLLI